MKKIIVTTSWDDGHKLDLKLARLLTKYGIKGTFYIAPRNREFAKSELLTDKQIVALSKDFEIGAHTLTHPLLSVDFKTRCDRQARMLLKRNWKPGFEITPEITEDEVEEEILGSKKYLEKLLRTEVVSFCYPDGRHNSAIQKFVQKAGFKYGRTVERYQFTLSKNIFASGTTLHALNQYQDAYKIAKFSGWNLAEFIKNMNWQNLAKRMFDYVFEYGGIFHFWGHSWLIEANNDWTKLENVLAYISNKSKVKYLENKDLAETVKK